MSGPRIFQLGNIDQALEDDECDEDRDRPGVVDEAADRAVKPAEILVGVPCGKANMREVDFRLTPGPATALGNQLFTERYVFFLWSLVPELGLVHVLREGADHRGSDIHAGVLGEEPRNFFVGAHAVEEQGKLPLIGWKTEIVTFSALHDADDGLAVENVVLHDQVGVEAGWADTRETRLRDLRQGGVQRFAQVHRVSEWLGKPTCMDMPGLSRGDGWTSMPMTWTLPLAGSTTGLTRRMRAGW